MTVNFLFTSDVQCFIKFNGAVLGNCFKTPLEFCAPPFENAVIEILPFNENKSYCNQSFLLKNNGKLSCLSPLLKITKFFTDNYGVHFCPKELVDKSFLKTICKQKCASNNLHHLATVFYDGTHSLKVECEQYSEAYLLPELTGITVSVIKVPETCFLFKGFSNGRIYIKIIGLNNGYYILYEGYVKEVKVEDNKLFILESFNDHMGHCLERICILENKILKTLEEKKSYDKNKDINQIPQEVISYIFIESIKNSFFEEEKEFLLTDNLQKTDIDYFKNYFGKFTDILQNPITSRLCLIKKITDNYFLAIDYDFEFENGKISNITTE